MALPQRIDPDADWCGQLDRWAIAPELERRLWLMAQKLPFSISIISGFRSAAEQVALAEAGRPAAPVDLSTHTTCPATGADLITSVAAVNTVKAQFGRAAVESGLRWGGGSPVDQETGIPSDWNHVDLGPRGQ